MTTAPAFLQLGVLDPMEAATVSRLSEQLNAVSASNTRQREYYEAERRVTLATKQIPDEVVGRLKSVIGWAGTTVDILEERLDFQGWTVDGTDDLSLGAVYDANELDVESGLGHLDALLYGVAFARVGAGGAGEPWPLVTMHSPLSTTGTWDARTRRLSSAMTITDASTAAQSVVVDLPDVTITAERVGTGPWAVVERDEHRAGRVLVARLTNRPRASRTGGRSEITRAVRYYCDAGVRTALGMEANRDFYSIPQLTILGRGADAFVDSSGNNVPAWKILYGHALAIDKDEDGDVPTIGQLSVSSPQPFLEQLRGWSQLLAAEVGMPTSYLGMQTDNPASADAIRAGEARLVKRAERRQAVFGRTWLEVARLALLVRDGAIPADFSSRVGVQWADAATPTRAAAADEASKYIAAGALPPDSRVTYARMGLSRAEVRMLEADKRRAAGSSLVDRLTASQQPTQSQAPPNAPGA